jgi:hypothetical protein
MITDVFAKAKPTWFVLEEGGMAYGAHDCVSSIHVSN